MHELSHYIFLAQQRIEYPWHQFTHWIYVALKTIEYPFYAFVAIISILCVLEKKIPTDNLVRAFGFLLSGVGALVLLAGKESLMMWIGIVVVLLTFLNDLWYWTQREHQTGRKTD